MDIRKSPGVRAEGQKSSDKIKKSPRMSLEGYRRFPINTVDSRGGKNNEVDGRSVGKSPREHNVIKKRKEAGTPEGYLGQRTAKV